MNSTPSIRPMALYRKMSGLVFNRWGGLSLVFATMLLKIGIDLLRPWPMKVLIDNVLQNAPLPASLAAALNHLPGTGSARGLTLWCVAATVLVFLLSWMLTVASTVASINFGKRLSFDLAGKVFAHLQKMSLRYHSRRSTGDSIRRVLVDSGCIATLVKDAFLPVLMSLLTLGMMFTILWNMSYSLVLVSLGVVPMMLWTFFHFAKPMADASYAQMEADSRIYETVERTLTSIPVVQAFCREEECDRELRKATNTTLAAAVAAARIQLNFKLFMALATALGSAGILCLGAHQVVNGTLSVGSLLVFLSYLESLYAPLLVVAYCSSTVQTAAGSAFRVLDLLETEHEVAESIHAKTISNIRGELLLDSVTVGYEPDRPALCDVSLHVQPGETIAIVGPTGAGKSTLVSLIPRFLDPWQGKVLLDGHNLKDLELKDLRKNISLVLQESFLFPITIAQNIAYGMPEATSEQIIAAAKAANAHEFISRLPDGYDSLIGERGANLSGGERQRLSIARALLKDAPVLILDEPTAALDARTESLLLEALRRLTAGRTTFVIAHRLSTIRDADRIVAVDAGRIVEVGSHETLITQNGLYAHLYHTQFGAPELVTSQVSEQEEQKT